MSLFDLTDKVAVITGASKGIGRAIAERMAEHGAKVVVSSRDRATCEEVAGVIEARGGQALVQPCNIGHKEQLQALVDASLAKWHRHAEAAETFGLSDCRNCGGEAIDRHTESQSTQGDPRWRNQGHCTTHFSMSCATRTTERNN